MSNVAVVNSAMLMGTKHRWLTRARAALCALALVAVPALHALTHSHDHSSLEAGSGTSHRAAIQMLVEACDHGESIDGLGPAALLVHDELADEPRFVPLARADLIARHWFGFPSHPSLRGPPRA